MNSVEIIDKKNILRNRCQEIVDVCKTEIRDMNDEELREFNENKEEINNLNIQLRELQERLNNIEVPTVEDEIIKENKRSKKIMNSNFRLIKAINDVANNRSLDSIANAVSKEGNEEMRKAGLSYGGQIQLPVSELRTISVASEGEDLVATDLYNILEPLRAKNVLVQAGAKFLTGLVGDVQVPVMDKSNVAWAGETATATSGDPTFTNVTLSPKRLTAYVTLSKQFLNQDSVDAESVIRQDILKAVSDKLEATILGSVTGNSLQPDGLLAGTAVSANTYSKICNLESDLEDMNVDNFKYIVSPKAKAAFRAMAKGTGDGLVWNGGEIDGVSAEVTSNVEAKKFIVGDFSNLAIGQWGSLDITVDPYTEAKNGCVVLVVNAYFDAKKLRDTFKVGTV